MEKVLRKISTFVLSLGIMVCMVDKVRAYDQSLIKETNGNIVFSKDVNNVVNITGDLAKGDIKVYQQYIAITEEEFNSINTKLTELNNYIGEDYADLEEKQSVLLDEAAKLDELENKAIASDATEEDKKAYQDAYAIYTTHVNEFNTLKSEVDNTLNTKKNDYIKLVPGYDNNKWNEVKLNKIENGNKQYVTTVPDGLSYTISWVKVNSNGVDSYQFALYCYKTSTTVTVETKEENKEEVKEKTPENPKTGIENYYAYGIAIVALAVCGFVATKSRKKFSK